MRWAIDVWIDGEEVLAIEPDSVSGKATFTAEETQAIRDAARSLMAFIGEEDTPWLDPDEPQPE